MPFQGASWRARSGATFDPLAPHPLAGAGVGVAGVALLVALLDLVHAQQPTGPVYLSIPLFFLVPVLVASALGGRGAGVLVSCIAVFAWDWFFIPPLYTVTIYYPRDLLALIVFLAVALLVGQLSDVARRRTEEALRRARSSEALYDLSLALIARTDPAAALPTLARQLRETFDLAACAVLLPDEAGHSWRTAAVAGVLPPGTQVEESRDAAAIAAWVTEHERSAGRQDAMAARKGSPIVSQGRLLFLPLRVGMRAIGVLELVYHGPMARSAARDHLLETFANGAALALEQERLAQEERAAAVARESDRLKSALLSSVSHDLRTPLAGLKVAVGSLLQAEVRWSEDDRAAFLHDMDRGIDHLTRLVSNLLDLSRIEAGALRADRDWEDVTELIDRVAQRLAPLLEGHSLRREGPAALPPVRLDAVQIEQALTNLLENAARYAPPGTPITVRAEVAADRAGVRELRLSVADQWPGIPRAEQARIFDKFYRVAGTAQGGAGGTGGTGMGLAIVRGLVEAHGGRVTVESAPGAGSTFTIILPDVWPHEHEDAGVAADPAAAERLAR